MFFCFLLFGDHKKRRGRKVPAKHIKTPEEDYFMDFDFEDPQKVSKVQNTPEKCLGPYTHRTRAGKCVCDDGFPFGDPDTEKGCWKCSVECHINAECVFPGVCTCKKGLYGDGKTKCEALIPVILNVDPREGPKDTLVNVSYKIDGSVNATAAYCRFGGTPVSAKEVTPSYILCKAPIRKPGFVLFSISFDAVHWSKATDFNFTEKSDPIQILPFFIMSLVLTISGVYSVSKIGDYLKKKDDDEGRPFIMANHNHKNAPFKQINRRKADFI